MSLPNTVEHFTQNHSMKPNGEAMEEKSVDHKSHLD